MFIGAVERTSELDLHDLGQFTNSGPVSSSVGETVQRVHEALSYYDFFFNISISTQRVVESWEIDPQEFCLTLAENNSQVKSQLIF